MSTSWIGGVSRLVFLVSSLGFISTAASQNHPSKPIRIINPWPAGGGAADAIARPVMDRVSKALGQPIFFDGKSGANGMVGTEYVAKNAAPDGYTC